jgi:hypothetical protein
MFYSSLNDLFSAYFIKYVFRKGRLAKEKSHQKSLIHLLSTLPRKAIFSRIKGGKTGKIAF